MVGQCGRVAGTRLFGSSLGGNSGLSTSEACRRRSLFASGGAGSLFGSACPRFVPEKKIKLTLVAWASTAGADTLVACWLCLVALRCELGQIESFSKWRGAVIFVFLIPF